MTYVTHPRLLTHLTHDPLTHCQLCPAVGCYYILSGPRLSSRLQTVTALGL